MTDGLCTFVVKTEAVYRPRGLGSIRRDDRGIDANPGRSPRPLFGPPHDLFIRGEVIRLQKDAPLAVQNDVGHPAPVPIRPSKV